MRERLYPVFFLSLLFFASPLFAEANHSETPEPTGSPRPPSEVKLESEMIELIQKFFNPSESYINRRFGQTLPAGLESAIQQQDEEKIAKDVAELLGQISDDRKRELLKSLTGGEAPCGKDDPNISRLQALKNRIIYLAKFALKIKEESRPACRTVEDTFLDAAKKFWAEVEAYNEKFHQQLELAKQGNTQAIEFVKKVSDSDALAGFLENQSDQENDAVATSVANDLTLALSQKNGKSHFLDAEGPGEDRLRLNLGEDPTAFAKRLRELKKSEPSFGGLGRFRVSGQTHEKPSRILPSSEGAKTPTPNPEPSTPPQPPGGKPAGPVNLEAAAASVLKANCVSCHGPGKDDFEAFPLSEDGLPTIDENNQPIARNSPDFLAKVKRILERAVVKGNMPPRRTNKKLSDEEKSKIRAWAEGLGVK